MSLVRAQMSNQFYPHTRSNKTSRTDGVPQMQDTNNTQEDLSKAIGNNTIHEDINEDIEIDPFANGDHNEQTEGDWVTTEVLEVINSCFRNEIKTMIDGKLSVILQTLEQLQTASIPNMNPNDARPNNDVRPNNA